MTEMSINEIQRIKYDLWTESFDTELDAALPSERLVAEGDSWFDYPPGFDILDNLKMDHGYKIYKVCDAGDTLENMVYGTEIRSNFSRKKPQILETLEAIERHEPRVFLFSGGGNDIAGPELETFLNHKDANLSEVIREEYARYVFFTVFKKAYNDLMKKVWSIDSNIHIIGHGYAHPIPDGRAVFNFPFGFRFIGPWLRPALTKKNIMNRSEAMDVMRRLLDMFNEMMRELEAENTNFHYIDLRPHIESTDWVNELHLSNVAYKRVADLFDEKIQEFIG